MSDTYEQHLKELARSFKNLNVQLLGFLLVGIGFLFTSETIMTNPAVFIATGGLSVTIFLWVISLIQFLGAEFSPTEEEVKTKQNKN